MSISPSSLLRLAPLLLPDSVSTVSSIDGNRQYHGQKRDANVRSRGGCHLCKLRRQKCDEIKPSCSRCVARGVACQYKKSLSFRDEYEKKGKTFGREGVWSKGGTKGGSKGCDSGNLSKQATVAKYQPIHHVGAINFVNYTMSLFNLALRQPRCFSVPIATPGALDLADTLFALNYYLDYIAPILNPVGSASRGPSLQLANTYVELEPGLELSTMIQYSQQHTHLFHMMLALGSMYLSKLDNDSDEWLAKAKHFRREAMKSIEGLFTFEAGQEVRYTTDQLLALVLLMLFELAEKENENWADFLHASLRIFFSNHFVQPLSDVEKALLKFSLELLNYQETMGRTACKARSNFFITADESESHLTPDAHGAQMVQVSWMGCNKDLILIISDITELSFERFSKEMTEDNYLARSYSMRAKLDSMQLSGLPSGLNQQIISNKNAKTFTPIDFSVTDQGSNVEVICYLLACEAKRISAVIYLECSLLNKSPKDSEIQTLVLRVYRILEFVVVQHSFNWFSTLLWTIFIVASEIAVDTPISEELRYLTMEILKRIESRSLGNVAMTIDLVVSIWKKRDLAEPVGKLGKKREVLGFENDWDTYVADESYRVSLA